MTRLLASSWLFLPAVLVFSSFYGATAAQSKDSPAKTNAKPAPPPRRPAELASLSLEVNALQTLHELELGQEQLEELAKLAKGAAQKMPRVQVKASGAYRAALGRLHTALVKSDDAQITESKEKLEEAAEKEEPELSINVEISETARKRGADAQRLLNARQAGILLASLDPVDPLELLTDALEEIRGLKDQEKKKEIDNIAEEVSWLVAGVESDERGKTKQQVVGLLNRAHGLKDDEFKKSQPDLEKAAHEIVGDLENLKVLGHILDHGLAELLSNPRLESAIKLLLQAMATETTSSKTDNSKTR